MIVKKTTHLEEDQSEGYIECIYDSSNILMSVYFPKNNLLYISFNRGGVYSYTNVDRELYDNFENSDSQGKFFVNEIKKNSIHEVRKEYTLYTSEVEDAKKILNEWKENQQLKS